MSQQSADRNDDGKIQPIKLTPEQLEKRKETGYKTDEESRRTPSTSGGKGKADEAAAEEEQPTDA